MKTSKIIFIIVMIFLCILSIIGTIYAGIWVSNYFHITKWIGIPVTWLVILQITRPIDEFLVNIFKIFWK
jgi:hypothetical protein